MRRALLVLALFLAPAPFASAQQGGIVVTPSSGDLATPFTFDATSLMPPLGPELVQNGGFDGTIYPWETSAREVKNRATFGVGRNDLHVEVWSPERTGTVFAKQSGALTGAQTYAFSLRMRASGGPFTYNLILREEGSDGAHNGAGRGSWDATYKGNITGNWTTFETNWTPRFNDSQRFVVFVRFTAGAGQLGNVTFDDVSLRPRSTYAWDLDADGVADAKTPTVKTTFPAPGNTTVRLTGRSASGARIDRNATVLVTNAAPTVEAAPPAGATFGETVTLVATARDPDAAERVPNPRFADGVAGWRAAFGPNVTGTLRGENGTLVLSGNATANGTAFAATDLARVANESMTLRARLWSLTGGSLAFILRERADNLTLDTKVNAVVAPREWTDLALDLRPQLANATRTTLLVGRSVDANAAFDLRYSLVSLQPDLNVTWDLDGDGLADAVGPTATLTPARAGPHVVRVNATDPWNASAEATVSFDVAPGPLVAAVATPQRLDGGEDLVAGALVGRPGPDLLRGGRWFATATDGNATVEESPDGALVARALSATDGTLTLSRRVPVVENQTYLLEARVEDEGGVRGYSFVLRNESGGVSTLATLEDAGAVTRSFVAEGRNATLSLLVRVEAGVEVNVTLSGQTLRALLPPEGLNLTWTLDGAPLASGADLRAPSPAPGRHVLALRAEAPDHQPLDVARDVVVIDHSLLAVQVDDERVELRWRAPPGVASYVLLRDGQPEPLDDVTVEGDDARAVVLRGVANALQVVADLGGESTIALDRVVLAPAAPLESTSLGASPADGGAAAWAVSGLLVAGAAGIVLLMGRRRAG